MNPRRRRVQWRYARNKFWRKQAAGFRSLGLTTRGTPRRYRLHPDLDHLRGQRRTNAWRRKQRAERRAASVPPVMRAYLEFRATIQMPELNFTTGRCE